MKFSYIAVCQKFRKVPPRDRRRQAHRGSTASARCTLRETASSGRALRFQIPTQLPFSPLPSFVWFLPPFAPRALPRFSATMASADCSPALTEKLSPGQVQNLPLGPSGSTWCVSDDFWASLFPASWPPAPGLTAGSCSYGREFATRFFQLHLAATPCVSLRLSSSTPSRSFHLDRFCPCCAHWGSAGRSPAPLQHVSQLVTEVTEVLSELSSATFPAISPAAPPSPDDKSAETDPPTSTARSGIPPPSVPPGRAPE